MTKETCAFAIEKEILDFILHNNIASVCCTTNNIPYCFNCFYSVLKDEMCIVFKSSVDTKHIQILADNKLVAGTIIDSDINLARVIGTQFEGIHIENDKIAPKASKSYYLRYPFAIAMPGRLWILELNAIKYTSTINGIKHKLEWSRD